MLRSSRCVYDNYVDENKEVQEDFIGVIKLLRMTGEAISTQILNQLEALGLGPASIRGKGYDEASDKSKHMCTS